MGLSAVTYALCKKYTDASLDGVGALKGAPCKVQSVVKTDGRSVVTLEWKSDSGIVQTSKVYVNDGVSIWISGRDYAVNDVVIKDNQLYICNTANLLSYAPYRSYCNGNRHPHPTGDPAL